MNGEHFILWTDREGGCFAWKDATRAQYDAAVESGTLRVPLPEENVQVLYARDGNYAAASHAWRIADLAFIAFGTVDANHDFVLGRSREAALARH